MIRAPDHDASRGLPVEAVVCYLCGSSSGRTLVDDPPFRVVLCACGLAYTTPRIRADRIHELYGDEYFASRRGEEFGYSCYAEELEGHLKSFRKKAARIRRHQPTGRVLEIGCAAGAFLAVMRDAGHEVTGLEISPAMIETGRHTLGLNDLRQGTLEDSVFEENAFSIVALFDVVEHVPDPVGLLRRCGRLLREDGLLVVQTQNVDSWARRILGRRWPHYKQLEHIYHFSPRTIADVLSRAGFTVVENTRRAAGKFVSFADIAQRAHRVGRIPRWMCWPLRALGNRFIYLNLLDEMLVMARRSPSGSGISPPRESATPGAGTLRAMR